MYKAKCPYCDFAGTKDHEYKGLANREVYAHMDVSETCDQAFEQDCKAETIPETSVEV